MQLETTEQWESTYPDAYIGILAVKDVHNPEHSPALDERKQALEMRLREQYANMDRAALKDHPTLAAYATYYKRFKKTYHVQLQLESIVFKKKSIPRVAALVEAMFMAELNNLLLTAGHDLDAIQGIPTIDVASGEETYIKINGQEQMLKAGDMYIRDGQGVLSSIIYGPSQRASIVHSTTNVLFTVYGPNGIDKAVMQSHLEDIQGYITLFSPDSSTITLTTLPAL
jgi:DNA/RNA-binding domain of Phe-tRNA-synthetase-like protein